MGMVTLAPLTDVLGPAAASLVNPLAAPLNPLLPGQIPLSAQIPLPQNSQFAGLVPYPLSSHLTSPFAVSPGTNLASSLGLPSTGPLSSHLTSPMAVPPGTTLATSLGLTSTGSLTTSSQLAGPLTVSQSSPLMAPLAGTVAMSLSSPLLPSAATPLGVSQNILPNLGLSEAPRVRLAEPLRGSLSVASAGPAASSKGKLLRGLGNRASWVSRFLLPSCISLTPPFISTPPHQQSPVSTPSRLRTQSPSTPLWVHPSRTLLL